MIDQSSTHQQNSTFNSSENTVNERTESVAAASTTSREYMMNNIGVKMGNAKDKMTEILAGLNHLLLIIYP